MKPKQAALAALLALAPAAWAQNAHTTREALEALFEVEGDSPYGSPYAGTLVFSALQSKYASANGHGYRNELKVRKKQRRDAVTGSERFLARVTPELPAGAKTIVAQYHGEGLDTLLKVYLQDTDKKTADGIAGNGIFDVLVRITGADGKEAMMQLGTIRSGETFDLEIRLRDGAALAAMTAQGKATVASPLTPLNPASRNIYFKFGDYLQARDPDTGAHTASREKWDQYFARNGIERSEVRFSGTVFTRE